MGRAGGSGCSRHQLCGYLVVGPGNLLEQEDALGHWAPSLEASLLLFFLLSSCPGIFLLLLLLFLHFSYSIFSFSFSSCFISPFSFSVISFSLLLLPFLFLLSDPHPQPDSPLHQLLRIPAPKSSVSGARGFSAQICRGRAFGDGTLRLCVSGSLGKGGSRVQSYSDEGCSDRFCLLQPQVQQLLHGVGWGLCESRTAGPDQPHGSCHWVPGGLGHWLNDLYSQWQREQHLFPGESRPQQLSESILMSQHPRTALTDVP